MDRQALYELFNFDIDRYLNPLIPHSRLSALPRPISHFLGYRKNPQKEPPVALQWVLMFIATVGGLCLVGGLFNTAYGITKWHPPVMIASLGASAVLDYNTIRSPLAQPRNTVIGHTLSAVVGVCISKLFQMAPQFFQDYEWVCGAVGCACASLIMSLTNTIHPPGGATAVLASTQSEVIALGWMFIPLVLLASVLMTAVACILNNILRQYPVCWWTPLDVGAKLREAKRAESKEVGEDRDASKLEKQPSIPDRYDYDLFSYGLDVCMKSISTDFLTAKARLGRNRRGLSTRTMRPKSL
jgi:hypothetical protein